MRKIKIISLFLSLLLTGNFLFAQSLEDGKRFLNYERYNSAKDVFNKLITANPNNVDAIYWLGQAYIGSEDTVSAKALYQKAIGANPNAPILLAAMGEIALIENNTSDARNRFETAISLSKGKDPNVLIAIGRANIDAKAGDGPYAIEKLKLTPENKRTAEYWTTLGDAYRKMTDGANAQLSYQSALAVDPKYARASFMIGRIYQTQGFSQEAYYMKYYDDAISEDPNFAPVFEWLSSYYYYRDINKAKEYLDKFIAVADPDSKSCYTQASFLLAAGNNQGAISKANECIASAGTAAYPKLYGVKGYAYDKLGDSANAIQAFKLFFDKIPPDELGPLDYVTYAKDLLKIPGNESVAVKYVNKAIALDTLEKDKVDQITAIAQSYIASKNYNEAAKWYSRLFPIKKNITKTDIYNAGYNYFKANNYQSSDSVFEFYQQKYPDDVLGYYMSAIDRSNIDSTSAQGLALPDYQKVIELAAKSLDTVRGKQQMITGYNYMVNYYYNVKKDKDSTISYLRKILEVDPTNTQAQQNLDALLKAPTKGKPREEGTKEKTPIKKGT